MPRGGKRAGAGPKRKLPGEKYLALSVRLAPDMLDAIRRGAAARGVSQSALITAAVRAYLDATPPNP